jgi:hypothetical protein
MTERFGRFSLDNMYNGNYRIIIKANDKNVSLSISEYDLEQLFASYVSKHISRFWQTYHLAFANPDAFIETEECKILEYLSQEETIPGFKYDKQSDIDQWHLDQWIMAYNRCYKTNLTIGLLKSGI